MEKFLGRKVKVVRTANLDKEYGLFEREPSTLKALVAFHHKPYANDLKEMEDLYND